jgi:predicted MFS family arabinose efflux permease
MDAEPAGRSMGHEFIGVVEAIGSDVRTLRVGDFVIAPFAVSCGTCVFCTAGLQTSCVRGGFWNDASLGTAGGQAEAVRVPLADGTLMGAVIFGIIESAEAGWGSARVQAALVLGALLLVGLVVHEGRVQQPILPLRLFRSRERAGAYSARLLYLGAMIGFFYFTTQLLQDGFGFSPLHAGLGFLPMTLVNFVVALVVPRLSARLSNGTLLATGTALTLAGMAWLSRIGPLDTYLMDVALPIVLVGAGQGLAFGPLTNAGIAGVDSADAGAASGLVNTAHQLGMALGLGILVALAADAGANLDGPAAVTEHVGAALTGGTVLLVLALVVVLTVIVPAARHRPVE